MGLESKNDISESLHQLKEVYRAALFDDLVPWWETHSVDRKNGGYYTRLAQDGLPYSEDKDMWMTGRQIWMFSHLYNRFEKGKNGRILLNMEWILCYPMHLAKMGKCISD